MLVLRERLRCDDEKMREDSNAIVFLLLQLFVSGIGVFLLSLSVWGCQFVCSFIDGVRAFIRLFNRSLVGGDRAFVQSFVGGPQR